MKRNSHHKTFFVFEKHTPAKHDDFSDDEAYLAIRRGVKKLADLLDVVRSRNEVL